VLCFGLHVKGEGAVYKTEDFFLEKRSFSEALDFENSREKSKKCCSYIYFVL